jgi:hypothetical protein
MKLGMRARLEELRVDFHRLVGYPFVHFYCPVLFRDEDTPLCKAHIVNQSFADSPREWTVQRKDVDNFYGAFFENDFLAVEYNEERDIAKVVTDKTLHNRFRPRMYLGGEQVEYYATVSEVPPQIPRLEVERDGRVTVFGLKISPDRLTHLTEERLEFEISKDIRVPAIVSLIKAGHLMLFSMLGYSYALSAGGAFVGRNVLGDFFLKNRGERKPAILQNAQSFFGEFSAMVRPVESSHLADTISAGTVLLCRDNQSPIWGCIIFIKTSKLMHSVLIPILDDPWAASRFTRFLKGEGETLEVYRGQLRQSHWEIARESSKIAWPRESVHRAS